MAEKVKLAFIGCGGIVRQHLDQGLKSFDDVEFAAWCDLKEENAAARREQVGGRGDIFTDARRMLDKIRPDGVYIMLPPFAHGPAEKLVIQRRLPFFVEKPVAIDLRTAKQIAQGVRKNRLVTAVGYMTRYRKSVQRVRELLRSQTPVIMHGGWIGGGPSSYVGIWEWWVQKDKSGGQFLEQTTHTIDLARYLFGDVARVYAAAVRGRKPRPKFYTIEDASMVQLQFANGAAANLYSSCSTPVGGGICLHVWATGMKAEFASWDHSVRIHLPDGEEIAIAGEPNIFAREDRAFVDSVRAGKNQGILATYEDGLKATAIACAANESMKTGQPVKLAV
ncbi:MAG: Gfo/Idh/MocA family oxidoreductase [Planctomycetes bacterium]|nr:Gfo/Idh/MocA family oxidoreductase [Planctomycetota bacterium]